MAKKKDDTRKPGKMENENKYVLMYIQWIKRAQAALLH